MYDEAAYICGEFEKNFAEKQKEPIALYGIGKRTGDILQKAVAYQIVGLLDGKRKKGKVWGKPILDYEDLLRLQVKTIVVVARPAVIGVIYHRIAEFCRNHGIAVYDIKGNDLSEIYKNQENDIPYFHQSLQDLQNEVEKHKVVSFDVFDTLIMRKVLYPVDIFDIVEKRLEKKGRKPLFPFAKVRIEAEKQLYVEGKNPTLNEIYEKLRLITGISQAEKEGLLELELSVEMDFIVPRKKMLELFLAIRGRKDIYLISDMYLPKEVIERMLKKCGYEGFTDVYVSCEKGMSKNGGLFEFFLGQMKRKGYEGADCIHIGDNEAADIKSAQDAGLHAFQVMSARELLECSSYRKLLTPNLTFVDRLAIGLLCERAFQNPFVLYGTKGKLRVSNIQDFTYLLIAPMIFQFTMWLIQRVCRSGCDYILYPSRDAYLIQKICQNVQKKQIIEGFPLGEYFYTSRRAILAATIWEKKDIYHVAEMDFGGSVRQLFQKRFAVEVGQPAETVRADNEEALNSYLEKYEQTILKQSAKERGNYSGYLAGTGIFNHEKIAFIDFVAAGKVQNGMEKLVPDKQFQGFYFLRRDPDKGEIDRDIQVESFFPSKGAFEIDRNVYKYYLFLEMVLTSPEATFHSVADDGKLCFMEETRSERHRGIVEKIQAGILEYTEAFLDIYPEMVSSAVDYTAADIVLGFLDKEYTTLDLPDVKSLVLTDEFLSQTFNIFET